MDGLKNIFDEWKININPVKTTLQLKQNCGRLAENVSERLNLYVKAFCAEDNELALTYISQAKRLTIADAKLLSSIKRYQVSNFVAFYNTIY